MTPKLSDRAPCACDPLITYSPSQIDTYRHCARKWGFRKLAKQPEPEFGFQKDGKSIHDALERFALTGELPPRDDRLSPPVWAAAKHLPEPNRAHQCEKHLSVRLPDTELIVHGYPDLRPVVGSDELPAVLDYKTVSVRKVPFEFALTPEALVKDAQGLIYAYERVGMPEAQYGHPGPDEPWYFDTMVAKLRWIYIERTKPFRVKVVDASLTATDLVAGITSITGTVKGMHGHREELTDRAALYPPSKASVIAIDYVNKHLEANTGFCDAYGGCPHRSICTAYNAVQKSGAFAGMGESDMARKSAAVFDEATSKLARIKASQGGGADDDDTDASVNPPLRSVPKEDPDEGDDDSDDDDEHAAELEAAQRALEEAKAKAAAAKKAAKAAKARAAERADQVTISAPAGSFPVTLTLTGSGATMAEAMAVLKAQLADL